jgi:hypothetical protein
MFTPTKNNNENKDDSHYYVYELEPIHKINNDIDNTMNIKRDIESGTGSMKNIKYETQNHIINRNNDPRKNMDDVFIEKLNNDLEQIRKNENIKHIYKENFSSEDSNEINHHYSKSIDTRAIDIYNNSNSPVSMSPQSSDNSPSDSDNEESIFFNKSFITFKDCDCEIDYNIGSNSDPSSLSEDNKNPSYNSRGHRVHYFDENEPSQHNINEKEDIQSASNLPVDKFKILSFHDIEKDIHHYYSIDNEMSHYNEIDILLTYLRGQKNLYFHANNITQIKLYFLTIPAVLLTITVIIIAPFITTFYWGGEIISAINSIIVLCITLANRLKLESETSMFFFLANQYDKIYSSLEVAGNRMDFFVNLSKSSNKNIIRTTSNKEGFKLKLKDIENRLNEIKESNVTMLPDIVKRLFPVISHINIFYFFKKIDNVKKNTIVKLRNVKNEIRYIIFKWNKKGIKILEEETQISSDFMKERNRLLYLLNVKEKIKEDIFHLNNSFEIIDDIFSREIKYAESKKNVIFLIFGCDKPKIEDYHYDNPFVKEYLKPIC